MLAIINLIIIIINMVAYFIFVVAVGWRQSFFFCYCFGQHKDLWFKMIMCVCNHWLNWIFIRCNFWEKKIFRLFIFFFFLFFLFDEKNMKSHFKKKKFNRKQIFFLCLCQAEINVWCGCTIWLLIIRMKKTVAFFYCFIMSQAHHIT